MFSKLERIRKFKEVVNRLMKEYEIGNTRLVGGFGICYIMALTLGHAKVANNIIRNLISPEDFHEGLGKWGEFTPRRYWLLQQLDKIPNWKLFWYLYVL